MPPPEQYIAPHKGSQIKSPLWQLMLPSWDDLPHFTVSLKHSSLPSLLQNLRSHTHSPALWHMPCSLSATRQYKQQVPPLPRPRPLPRPLPRPRKAPRTAPPSLFTLEVSSWSCQGRSCLLSGCQPAADREAECVLQDEGTSPEQTHCPGAL